MELKKSESANIEKQRVPLMLIGFSQHAAEMIVSTAIWFSVVRVPPLSFVVDLTNAFKLLIIFGV